MKLLRPLASTSIRARTIGGAPAPLTRTVTPSPSKSTDSTVAGWKTDAPERRAWSSRIVSNSARGTS